MSKNRLKGMKTYLIGPMECVEDSGIKWRDDILYFLSDLNIGIFNPCDKQCGVGRETSKEIKKLAGLKKACDYDKIVKMTKDIVRTDLTMVDLSDFVIVYIDMDAHMCGSYIELAYAALERKPVLVVCKQGKQHIPGFIWGMCGGHKTFFSDFNELQNYLRDIAFDDNIDCLKGRWKFFNYDKVYRKSY